MNVDTKKLDTKEFELPETTFIHDIDDRIFQGIVLEVLSSIDDISPAEGGLIDSIFGRTASDSSNAVIAEQDSHAQSVSVRIEINVAFGISIPEKAEEIQQKITEAITRLTGLHVDSVHVVFKNIVPSETKKSANSFIKAAAATTIEDEYTDEF